MNPKPTHVSEAVKMSWDAFAYDYFDSGWFHQERPKTALAVRHFYDKVPAAVLDKLAERKIILFAPMPAIRGEVMPITTLKDTVLIYLSPKLESNSQRRVDATVAHEFAHVFLGNYNWDHPDRKTPQGWKGEYREIPVEKALHELLEEWGFEKPRKKKVKP